MFKLLGSKEKTEEGVKKSRETWFGRVRGLFQRGRLDDDLWDELEELLISADVGVATTEKLLERVKERIREEGIGDALTAMEVLKEEMVGILQIDGAVDLSDVGATLPLVILVVGVNGAGKTTGIAKLTRMYKDDGRGVILGAADTFRAAAIEQLQAWGSSLGVEVIAHRPGGDPGAVAFDALQAARSRGLEVLIIDTAGRLHTKFNLMEELKKIQRVLLRQDDSGSHRVLLVLDATTGQNGLFQARQFTETVACDGIFLAKLDGTAKGGILLAICDELKLPVLFIGTGEKAEDIAPFDPAEFVEALFASGNSN